MNLGMKYLSRWIRALRIGRVCRRERLLRDGGGFGSSSFQRRCLGIMEPLKPFTYPDTGGRREGVDVVLGTLLQLL